MMTSLQEGISPLPICTQNPASTPNNSILQQQQRQKHSSPVATLREQAKLVAAVLINIASIEDTSSVSAQSCPVSIGGRGFTSTPLSSLNYHSCMKTVH
jgi:hypothetical protein